MSKRIAGLALVLWSAMAGAWAIEPCNFDGVGGEELAAYEPQSGNWYISTLSSQVVASGRNWGWSDAVPAPGDFDGDGTTDLSIYYRDLGMWFIQTVANSQLLAYAEVWGDRNMIPVPGDYDGDGDTDLGVYERKTGRWFIKTLGDNQILAYALAFGNQDCLPVPGDYNNDGKDEIGVYYKPLGYWFARDVETNHFTIYAENWGNKGMWPVPADYNGDGQTDLGVYERKTGNWFIKEVGSNAPIAFARNFGAKMLAPCPGDYNGDGSADLGVFYRKSGLWFIQSLADSQTLANARSTGSSNRVPAQCYAQKSGDGVKILCFGDSITYGMGSDEGDPDTGYPIRLERKLDTFNGGSFFTVNVGDPGEGTTSGRSRLPGELNSYKPDLLLLMEGTNDARDDGIFDGHTESNLRAMVDAALSRGIRCVIATIPPVIKSAYRDRTGQQSRIKSFNPEIYDIAGDKGIPVAKVYEFITAQPNWESNLMEQKTANHPNDAGYNYVRDAFYEAVRGLMLSGNLY